MKKISYLILIVTALLLMLTLSACGAGSTDGDTPGGGTTDDVTPGGSDDGTGDGTPNEVEAVIFSKTSAPSLVVADGAITEENLNRLSDALDAVSDYTRKSPEDAEGEHLILVGRSEHELSRQAYLLLKRQRRDNDTSSSGYVIYSSGTSIAIAYDDELYGTNTAQHAAVEYFVKSCLGSVEDGTLEIAAGEVENTFFDTVAYQEKLDEEYIESVWASSEDRLKEKCDEELAAKIIASFKELYKLYDTRVYGWYADLYDGDTGGFYYSNSARNNEGFLPDLESTSQALGFIRTSGLALGIEGGYANMLPDEMKTKIVEWVKGLQDSESGYFYHPQWGKSLTDRYLSRRGRDLQWAVNILTDFGASPKYDTPNGMKGESAAVPTAFTTRLAGRSSLKDAMVAMLVSSTDENVSGHLVDDVSFKAYLATLDVKGNSYSVGNTLESQAKEIVARDKVLAERGEDYRLADILARWLGESQDPETGIWATDNPVTDDGINGLLKIASTYNRIEKPFPNLAKAIKTATDSLFTKTDPAHVCSLLNPWYAINILIENAESYSDGKDDAAIEEARATILAAAPELIDATARKLALFKKADDGSFSYYPDHTSTTSQGMVVALDGTNEGDVNASSICILGVPGHIFEILGITRTPVCTPADRIRFLDKLENQGSIIKTHKPDDREKANGEFYQKWGGEPYENESTKNITTVVRADYYITENVGFDYYEDGNTLRYKQEFINTKTDSERSTTFLEYGKSKEKGYYRGLYMLMGTTMGATFTFETDLRISTISEDAIKAISGAQLPYVADLTLANLINPKAGEADTNESLDTVARIYLNKEADGGYSFSLGAAVPSYAFKKEVLSPSFKLGEWVTVAVEVFENGSVKYYLNNELFLEVKLLSDGSVLEKANALRLAFSSDAVDTAMHIDYTMTAKLNTEYTASDKIFDAEGAKFTAGNYFPLLGGMTYDTQPTSDGAAFFRASYYGVWADTLNNSIFYDSSYRREGIAMIDGEGKDGKTAKLFEYCKGSARDYYNGIYYGLNSDNKSGDVFVLETDFKLQTISDATLALLKENPCLLDITLAKLVKTSSGETDQNESIAAIGGIYVDIGEDGEYTWRLTNKREGSEEGFGMALESDKWYTLTIEVYANGTAKYYVDGTLMGDRALAVSPEALGNANVLRLSLTESVVASSVRIDNTFFGKVTKEYGAGEDYSEK